MLNEQMPAQSENVNPEQTEEKDNKSNEILLNIAEQLKINNARLDKIEKSKQEETSYQHKKQEIDEDDLDEDAILERKLKSLLEQNKKQEAEKQRRDRNKNPLPYLKQELPDFDKIYTKENLEMIDKKFPATSYAMGQKLNAGEVEDAMRLAYSVISDDMKIQQQKQQETTQQANMYNQQRNPKLAGSVASAQGARTTAQKPYESYTTEHATSFKFDPKVSVILNGNAFRSTNGIPFCKSEQCKKSHEYIEAIKNNQM